jgi:hypothetical protein
MAHCETVPAWSAKCCNSVECSSGTIVRLNEVGSDLFSKPETSKRDTRCLQGSINWVA